jgi:hypothetical protein
VIHGLHAVERAPHRARIEQIAVSHLDAQPLERASIGTRPRQHPNGGARRHQLPRDVGADKPRPARD